MNDVTPPPDLEDRIVRALEREGLLRRPRRAALLASAGAALVAAGVAVGWFARRDDAPNGPRYLLLLESPAAEPPAGEPERVSAIIAWARGQREAGRRLGGEKLVDGGWQLSAAGTRPLAAQPLGGYFVVSAADDADALRVAAAHPLIGWGGRILVRRIDEL